MRVLIAPNEPFIFGQALTKLSGAVEKGENQTLDVANTTGFESGQFVVVGHRGTELAELTKITAIDESAGTIQLDTLRLVHQNGEPIQRIQYDKRKFYGASSEHGDYVELTDQGSPRPIQVDNPQGTHLEYPFNEKEWFKATYFNSETDQETALEESIAVKVGITENYTTIYNIRREAGLINNGNITDDYLEQKRLQAENEVDSVIIHRYRLPLPFVPDLITNITTALAVGYVAYEHFDEDNQLVKRLGEARGALKAISEGRQRLLDEDKQELPSKTFGKISSHPSDGRTRKFTTNQEW